MQLIDLASIALLKLLSDHLVVCFASAFYQQLVHFPYISHQNLPPLIDMLQNIIQLLIKPNRVYKQGPIKAILEVFRHI